MYFNNETDAVNFLIEYLLPFLNADFEIDKKIEKIIKENSKYIKETALNFPNTEQLAKTLDKNNRNISELVRLKETEITGSYNSLKNKCIDIHNAKTSHDKNEIQYGKSYDNYVPFQSDLIEYLHWLIKTPFKLNNKNDFKAINYEKQLDKYLKDNFQTRSFSWRGIARCRTILSSNNFYYTNEELVKKICSFAVTECLWTNFDYDGFLKDNSYIGIEKDKIDMLFENNDNIDLINQQFSCYKKNYNDKTIFDYLIKGEGFKHVGLCPICDRIFHKNRKDKEYCSIDCSKIGSMRKLREKSK